MLEQVEIEGQLSMFDMDETKNKLYEVLEANNYHYEIKSYYLHHDYIGLVKYFYIRTTDNTIIDLCLSEFPEVFAVYEGFTEAQIKKIYRGRLQ
ncbi:MULTISPECIES: hypothetical protein [Bacillus]|uniref:Uncharacterized protein n=1 Tax=Bacillus mycoides TaxID=1405 RepID=A0A2B5Q2W7_BACMY|nr:MULTISPECIES: hypothetical protein [Bacillus]MBK5515537.1 hypothetical protein [Bacillus sp. TH11]ETT86950.1 hypothetical protein C174_00555 [Bacillus mycoides FSL H7-687]MBK5503369.1 hypothetical protein [Bacillus sp. TH12]OOR15738.1 hypothetical protein BW891_24710 [Bacillus mycoides]PGA04786.1 hypothetical protein COL71_27385 [Bacillus mycoides]